MSPPDLSLLRTRRLGPMFAVQFLGAFNDNLLKFALLFMANFSIFAAAPEKAEQLAVVATGLFILPYFLFSALAGQIADRVDKALLVRVIKCVEVPIMALALLGFWLSSVTILLVCLLLMGTHSSFFGPVKYSILPQHLRREEIMGGTGLVEGGTFLAILGGQLLAGLIDPQVAGVTGLVLAVAGLAASFSVPTAPPATSKKAFDLNLFRGTWHVLRSARQQRSVWLAILAISWFFTAGAVLVSEFAPLVSGRFGGNQSVVNLFLAVFSVMIAVGSLAVNRLLKGEVSVRFVPVSALGMAAGLIDLWLSARGFGTPLDQAGIAEFLAHPGAWRPLTDVVLIAFSGGMFIVPLYAVLQVDTAPGERSQAIAANNIVNAAVTVVVVGLVSAMLAGGMDAGGVVGALGIVTLAVALISLYGFRHPPLRAP
ncbi:MFS transporter [Novosphingobium sp. M1R2S20]|uniref:MFS transporter n=1 Tax=Novosphingobium rhizovicinum TaxID=3228928 RepID=A0ABV3R8V5_9SPHN